MIATSGPTTRSSTMRGRGSHVDGDRSRRRPQLPSSRLLQRGIHHRRGRRLRSIASRRLPDAPGTGLCSGHSSWGTAPTEKCPRRPRARTRLGHWSDDRQARPSSSPMVPTGVRGRMYSSPARGGRARAAQRADRDLLDVSAASRYQSGLRSGGRRLHEPRPGRNRDGAAEAARHDRRRLVEPEPDAGDEVRRVADEPRVGVVVGRARSCPPPAA